MTFGTLLHGTTNLCVSRLVIPCLIIMGSNEAFFPLYLWVVANTTFFAAVGKGGSFHTKYSILQQHSCTKQAPASATLSQWTMRVHCW